MGSTTSPPCNDPSEALRARDPELLAGLLTAYVARAEPGLAIDVRDVLVGLAPYHDCARRLGLDPVALFDSATATTGSAMRDVASGFARRADITLEAFGWRLVATPDGPCYRPDSG